MNIESIVASQRAFFASGKTFDIAFRKQALKSLRDSILRHEKELLDAIQADLGKSSTEAYMCEVGLTLSTIRYTLKHINQWARTRRMPTPLTNFHSRSMIVQEPYGVVLVMSPWNYPVLLSLEPLIGAIAAGNTVVLKPSAYSANTSNIIAQVIEETFDSAYVSVIKGGREANQSLLEEKFDYIFFTGGVNVGKLVMQKASAHLTPITLELGGKSPCIVERSADLQIAARRIVFGKFLNCGQTCIAPDYILVEKTIHDEFVKHLIKELTLMYGEDILTNPNYGKIINRKHYDRLLGLITQQKIVFGGKHDEETLRIEPTILDHVTGDDAVMQEEIFGPLLPILSVSDMDEAYHFVQSRPHPLALYLFTNNAGVEKRFLTQVPFGGGCINDTIIHIATKNLPFGGIGNSGMGRYHGKYTFDTFSHEKSVVKKYTWLDLHMRYQPYTTWKEKLIRFFLK
ncbi:MAG: aldehyde dehydrogenase [Paludibacteraceae bacterium]|nr:aldehyde dehydrogenase [Paludibacteraceae bacterium]